MKTLYIDCGMGCAGDMLTGALLELHPDGAGFLERMNAALAGRAVISAAGVEKCGYWLCHGHRRHRGSQRGGRHYFDGR